MNQQRSTSPGGKLVFFAHFFLKTICFSTSKLHGELFMKIRQGFVTNSSSTSFVISLREKFSKKNFLKALGVDDKFLLRDMIEDIWRIIKNRSELIESEEALEELYFDDPITEKIKQFIESGREVYSGDFEDSCDDHVETFLRYSNITIDEDDLYFNLEYDG
jgi:hypothetical protein